MSSQRFTLIQLLAAYAVALVVMGALDGVWLGWLAKDFYREQLGPLMTDSVRIVPAAIYYLGFPAVIVYLALTPAASLGEAALRSAVLGLAAFGVYDLTNLAILRGYTLTMAAVDMAWGTFASAVGGAAAYRAVMALR
ncbi:DUF2177 family protein [Rhizobacter fulvus]|jgi:uncharacterized membrane protein